jgi:hypothetical protein
LFGFIMAEILQKALQNAIDEQGEMEDKKSQKAPAIDSIIVTGPDIIQLPKTEVKEVATDEGADAVQASSPEFNPKPPQSNMNDAGTNAAIAAKEANERAPDEKADSVQAAPPKLNPKMTKPDQNDAAQEASAAEAKAPESEQRTSPVITTAAELDTPNPTKPTANDAGIDVTSTVEDPEVMVATVSDSIPTVMATNDDGRTPPELNQKLTQPGENDAATDASAAEAKATNDDGGTVSQREVSQPPSVDQPDGTRFEKKDSRSRRKQVIGWYSRRVGRRKQVIGCYSRRVGRRKQVIGWYSRRVSRRKQVIGCYSRRVGRRKQVIGWDSRRVGRRKQVIGWYSRRVGRTGHGFSF